VNDTFNIWPHRPEKLEAFLDKVKSIHQNTQFIMEMERNNHLSFLDTDIVMGAEHGEGGMVLEPGYEELLLTGCSAPQ
jgi:hypothetical protein